MDPISEYRASLIEEETQVCDDPPRPQPSSIFIQPEAHHDSETMGPKSEEPQLVFEDIDVPRSLVLLLVESEIRSGASLPSTATKSRIDVQEMRLSATSGQVADHSDCSQPNVEPVDSFIFSGKSSVHRDEPSTPRPSSPADPPFGTREVTVGRDKRFDGLRRLAHPELVCVHHSPSVPGE